MKYECIKCKNNLLISLIKKSEIICNYCSMKYYIENNYLRYDYDELLFNKYKKKYLMNKILNNNGLLSYYLLKENSLSYSDREDVKHFKKYISNYIDSGEVLDIGCGVLPKPGYLNINDNNKISFFGLDPIDDKSFNGTRIVGCSEFTPFQNNSFRAIIFATSLDHVCSITDTIREAHRILKYNGYLFVWMSDRSLPLINRLRKKLKKFIRIVKAGYRIDRYKIFSNNTVLYVPKWAIDPFHSFFEDPKKIIKLMDKGGFKEVNMTYNNKDEVFLCFQKQE